MTGIRTIRDHASGAREGMGSCWSFAFTRILGELRDELRRFDHLTRKQRGMVAEDASGNVSLEEEGLEWINPEEPVPLDATVGGDEGKGSTSDRRHDRGAARSHRGTRVTRRV